MLKLAKHLSLVGVWKLPNCTHLLSDDDLKLIGARVWEGFDRDKQSRAKWEKRTQAAMDLALQVSKAKTFPWPGSANVAFPLVTIACLQFHSRAYPTLVQGPDIVKYRVVGEDPGGQEAQRAERIGTHMSWQVMEEDQAWEEQHDRMFLNVPIVGCAFQKSYHDPAQGGNVSELVLAQDLVLDYYAKSVESACRKTQIVPTSRNEIYSGVMEGRYRDVLEEVWYSRAAVPLTDEQNTARRDNRLGEIPPSPDADTPFTFLEQHCWLDLDGDGYAEPWIVTIEASSRCVVRLVARWDDESQMRKNLEGRLVRITATEYYTKYGFIPSPDGGVYDVGFGVLLGPLNSSVNTILNQLIDAGTLQTTSGGFLARGAKIRGGQYAFSPFGWNRIDATGDDLRKSMVPFPVNQPSDVLFKLLGLLIDYTGRVAGVTDTMVGENPGQNTPAQTTQTMMEQGMKIYSAIFKRMWRSMKEEFKKLYSLNAVYLPDTYSFGPQGSKAMREDYLADSRHVAPAADPHVVSDAQQYQRAITIKQAAAQTPGYDLEAVERNFLRALKVDGVERLYPGPQKTPPLPNPKMMVEQAKGQARMQELQLKLKWEMQKETATLMEQHRVNTAKILQLEAQAAKLVADANGVETGHQLAAFNAAIGAIKQHDDMLRGRVETLLKAMELGNDVEQQNSANGGGMGGMGGPAGNAGAAGGAPAAAGGPQGPMGQG